MMIAAGFIGLLVLGWAWFESDLGLDERLFVTVTTLALVGLAGA